MTLKKEATHKTKERDGTMKALFIPSIVIPFAVSFIVVAIGWMRGTM